MFTETKNIDSAFRYVRSFCIVFLCCCIVLVCFIFYRCEVRIERAENKALILFNGKVLSAMASTRKDNIGVEARDHIKTFHELFFTLEPDEKQIQSSVNQALYLADASAKKEYDNLKESGYYSSIIAGNISQHIRVDSVSVDLLSKPYAFKCFATQQIIRTTSNLTRKLITEGFLRDDVDRSDNNNHGFLIERWRIVENSDIKIENR